MTQLDALNHVAAGTPEQTRSFFHVIGERTIPDPRVNYRVHWLTLDGGRWFPRCKLGAVQLPDLQRPFAWAATKVRDVFDSLYRGDPAGERMLWDISATGKTRSISRSDRASAAHQIIDGQLGRTSFYAVIKGQKVRDINYGPKEITISINPLLVPEQLA